MNTKISDIAYYLPTKKLTNTQLKKENPDWNIDVLEKRSGVYQRYIAAENETALDLAVKACENLFLQNNAKSAADLKIDGIIFCTQSPDYIMPPNACVLHGRLGLNNNVFSMDYSMACSGYIYGLSIVRGLITSGQLNSVLLITSETYSKYIHPDDRSVRALFGDGAAVTWLTASTADDSILDTRCFTTGKHYDLFIIPAGGCRKPKSSKTAKEIKDSSGNIKTEETIHMDGMGILSYVNAAIPNQIQQVLTENSLKTDDIDLFIFHQASQIVLDSLTRLLKIAPQKVFNNIKEVANTVSASIPIALKQAMEQNIGKPGDLVLLCGFGVGLSSGVSIIRLPVST